MIKKYSSFGSSSSHVFYKNRFRGSNPDIIFFNLDVLDGEIQDELGSPVGQLCQNVNQIDQVGDIRILRFDAMKTS